MSPEQVDDTLRLLGFHPEHQIAPVTAPSAPSAPTTSLRRSLQSTPSPRSVAGYLQISYHSTSNCMDSDPVVTVLGYGMCVQTPTGSSFGSYTTVFSLPTFGPQVVLNLTTTYKGPFCDQPVSAVASDPVPLAVNAAGDGITLESCVQIPTSSASTPATPTASAGTSTTATTPTGATSLSTPAGAVSFQIQSLSSYLPHVGTQGVALASFSSPEQCKAVQESTAGEITPLKLVYQSCVQVVAATQFPPTMPVWARYDVQGDRGKEPKSTVATAVRCYSDSSCFTSVACPSAITPAWADNTLYVTSAGSAPTTCPSAADASNQYTVACLYDPETVDTSKCVPYNGPAEVPEAAGPLIDNYIKVKYYDGDASCNGDYIVAVMAFGQCARNYEGIPNVRSYTSALTVNEQNTLESTITYYSDEVCGKKNQVGKPVTVSFSLPGTTAQVGKCFQPEVPTGAAPTSFFLQGIYDAIPPLDFDGISHTGFSSEDQCAQQLPSSITTITLQTIGRCQAIPGYGSVTPTCNSTTLIYQFFSDIVCQVPQPAGGTVTNPLLPFSYRPLGVKSCVFQGNKDTYSAENDNNLYVSSSCYTAPVTVSKKAFVINAALITGCTLALASVFASIAACCWYQNIYMPSKALAAQEEQDYGDQPLPPTRRASTGADGLDRFRAGQPSRLDAAQGQGQARGRDEEQQEAEGGEYASSSSSVGASEEGYVYDDHASSVPPMAFESGGRASPKRLSSKGRRASSSSSGSQQEEEMGGL